MPDRSQAALPRRVAAALAALLAALLLWTAAGPQPARALDYEALFSLATGETPDEPRMSRPADPERPPDLAAYGRLDDYDGEASMVRRTTEGVGVFRQRLERMLADSRAGLADFLPRLQAASPDGRAGYFAGVALVAGILILIGRAVVQLYAVYIARPLMIAAQRASPPVGVAGRLPVLALRMALTVAALAVNLAVALGLGLWLVESHPPSQATAGILLAAYGLFILIDTTWRMTLCPYLSDYRIPRLSDAAARRLYLWMSAITGYGVLVWAGLAWMTELEIEPELVRLCTLLFGFAALLLILGAIWSNREGVSGAVLRGRSRAEASRVSALGAALWAPLAALYFIAAWMQEAFRMVMGQERLAFQLTGALGVLMAALLVHALGLYITERAFHRRRAAAPGAAPGPGPADETSDAPGARAPALPAEAAAAPAPAAATPELGGPLLRRADPEPAAARPEAAEDAAWEEDGEDGGEDEGGGARLRAPASPDRDADGDGDRDADEDRDGEAREAPPHRGPHVMRSYEDLARRVSSLLALGAAAYLLILIWGGAEAFAEGAPLDSLLDVLDILLVGYVAYHAVRIWLDNRIAEEGGDDFSAEPGDEGGGASAVSRLGTLLPLFRSAVLATIGLSAALVTAAKLGLNVAPLFAGAGIVGIAIGFGAQTLVRDILSGMFFLLDDAFRKGEYIDVGEVKGTVEKISLRSFQLRHHLGALHTIPFGEIKHLTNFSRDWVMMKLPLRLTYDTDPEKVRKLVKKLGQRLLEHPTEGRKFVQPLKSQGVYMMEDSAMIIRIKYMTRPGDQWTTRKLVYSEIRDLFEQEGIRFAHREVTVRIPDLDRAEELGEEERRALGAAARRAVDDVEGEAAGPPAPSPAEAR